MTTPCDPLYDNVVLLLNFQGANGSKVFIDESSYAHPMTDDGAGNVALDTSLFKWAPSSANMPLDGSFVSTPNTTEFDISTGDWCYEFWYQTNGSGLQFFPYYAFTSLYPANIQVSATSVSVDGADTVGATAYEVTGVTGAIDGVWNHVAVVRTGSTFTLYLNGVGHAAIYPLGGSGFAGALGHNTGIARIGSSTAAASNLAGVRWTVGVPRYTANFTPPPGPFGTACPVGTAVPDVTGELPSDGETDITNVGLTVDQTFTESSETIPAGRITRTVPTAGTIVTPGSAVSIYVSTGSGGAEIPAVTGDTIPEAEATLAPTVFVLGQQFSEASPDVPKGRIIRQSPVASSHAADGTAIDVWVSTGPGGVIVPQLEGDSSAAGALALAAVGLGVGPIGFSTEPGHEIGTIVGQTILAGTVVPLGTKVGFTISILLAPFDIAKTVISQYANSPTILALVNDMAEWIDPRTNFEAFYTFVWNVDTAQGFGLDIWGRIVDVSRLLHIPGDSAIFGFSNADRPYDWQPWNQGTFNSGNRLTQTYVLTDDAYRVLILTKALANIAATNSPSLNALLRNLFPGRGKCYVVDQGNMSMQFVFEFSLTAVELAILTQSGALPHPAGVSFSVLVVPTTGFFGFRQGGGQTFGHGPFYGG